MAGGLNTYGYVYQNPVNYIDPDGLNPLLALCARFPSVCAGAANAVKKGAEWCKNKLTKSPPPKPPVPKYPKDLLDYKKTAEDVLKGNKPLNDLPPNIRKQLADYYQSVADTVNGKKTSDAARRLNQARSDYLKGKRPTFPGQAKNFL